MHSQPLVAVIVLSFALAAGWFSYLLRSTGHPYAAVWVAALAMFFAFLAWQAWRRDD